MISAAFDELSIREGALQLAYQRNPGGSIDQIIDEAKVIEAFMLEKLPKPAEG